MPQLRLRWGGKKPIDFPIQVSATFFREKNTGDLVNYMQALADGLQKAKVIEDDCLIISWDGSRLAKDATNPRIELTLRRSVSYDVKCGIQDTQSNTVERGEESANIDRQGEEHERSAEGTPGRDEASG